MDLAAPPRNLPLHGSLDGSLDGPASVTSSLEPPCCCPPGLCPSHPNPSRDPVGLRRRLGLPLDQEAVKVGEPAGSWGCWAPAPHKTCAPFKTELGEARPMAERLLDTTQSQGRAPPALPVSGAGPGHWCPSQTASPGAQGPCLDDPHCWALCDREACDHVLPHSGLTVS